MLYKQKLRYPSVSLHCGPQRLTNFIPCTSLWTQSLLYRVSNGKHKLSGLLLCDINLEFPLQHDISIFIRYRHEIDGISILLRLHKVARRHFKLLR